MSRGVNKVTLIGYLGADPEIYKTENSEFPIATISLATSSPTKNKDTGQWEDATEWHRVVFFERTAQVVEQYLRKGSQIYVDGRLRTRKWQDKEGKDRWTTEIVGREMQMLGGRGDNTQPSQGSAPRNQSYNPPSGKFKELPEGGDFEDDVPF